MCRASFTVSMMPWLNTWLVQNRGLPSASASPSKEWMVPEMNSSIR